MNRVLIAVPVVALLALSCSAFAGGELSESSSRPRGMSQRTAETRAHIASLQKGLAQFEMSAALEAQAALDARAKKVTAVQPIQDKFGDPMYTWYGPLVPEPGTPEYDGPAYGASFARGYAQPIPDGEYRGYTRGGFSQPGFISHTDVVLGTAASNMYMQSGMQVAPGSMAPSAARAMINNP
jgi:hypothetical protein